MNTITIASMFEKCIAHQLKLDISSIDIITDKIKSLFDYYVGIKGTYNSFITDEICASIIREIIRELDNNTIVALLKDVPKIEFIFNESNNAVDALTDEIIDVLCSIKLKSPHLADMDNDIFIITNPTIVTMLKPMCDITLDGFSGPSNTLFCGTFNGHNVYGTTFDRERFTNENLIIIGHDKQAVSVIEVRL